MERFKLLMNVSVVEAIHIERGLKIAHELGMISFIFGYVVSNCCVQQKGRNCDAKYNSVETFHDNVWMLVIRIIYSKKAQNILVSFRTIRKAFTKSAAKATPWYLKRISTSGMSVSNDGPTGGQSFITGPADLTDAS